MLKQVGAVLASLVFLTSIGFAQDSRYDFSLNGAAVFTKQSSGNQITQTATDGGGGFGTIRLRFKPKHSFVFNYGRFKNSQIYQSIDNFHVLTNISEYSFAYMFTPFQKGRWEPFVLAGLGPLRFSPNSTWVFFPPLPGNIPNNIQVNLNASKQTELGYIYGLGVDYRIPYLPRFAVRLQYRGILYKNPDFNVDANHGSNLNFFTSTIGHMAEPSLGIVFRF
jgi:hypothetical protein